MLETSKRRITLLSLIFLVKNKQHKKVFGTRKYVEKHNFTVRQREFKSDSYTAGKPDIFSSKRLTLPKEIAKQAGNHDASSISGRGSLCQALDQCRQAKQASE